MTTPAAFRRVPDICVKFIEREEGERLTAYRDKAGMWTCGVGHTQGVTPGTRWDQALVDCYLTQDLQTAVQRLYWAIGEPAVMKLSDYQYSALISFVFNAGEKASWHVWGDIRAGQLALVPGQLKLFDTIGGKPDKGLANRRAAEIALWLGKDPLCADYPLSKAA